MAELTALPSVQLDALVEDPLDATQGSVTCLNDAPFDFAINDTLTLKIDGGSTQTFTVTTADVVDIDAVTAQELVDLINATLSGGLASVVNDVNVRITTDVFGAAGSVQVTGGNIDTVCDFPSGVQSGTDASDLVLCNRIPEPGEVEVPGDLSIQFDLLDPDGSAPVNTGLDVYIEGVLAVSAGVAQSGFSLTTSNPSSEVLRAVVNPTAVFDSAQIVTVRVVYGALDESYDYTVEDRTAPSLSEVYGYSKNVVRVVFDDTMTMESVSGPTDTLNPANYTITRVAGRIEVAVEVLSVLPVDAFTVDLVCDIPLTFGESYILTVENVGDEVGNIIDTGTGGTLAFNAFLPDFPTSRSWDLWTMLPQLNREEDVTGDLRKFIALLQETSNLMLSEVDDFATILDPDTAPEDFIDAMLWDLGEPFDFVLDEPEKRLLLSVLVPLYQVKGTKVGIEDAIRLLMGLEVTVVPYNGMGWVLGEGELGIDTELGPGPNELYAFEVWVPRVLTSAEDIKLRRIVGLMRTSHTHLSQIVVVS